MRDSMIKHNEVEKLINELEYYKNLCAEYNLILRKVYKQLDIPIIKSYTPL